MPKNHTRCKEVVVTQVVELWHSVLAGRVRLTGQTKTFFQFRLALNLKSLGVGLFLITCNRMVQTLPSSFMFPIIIYHCKIYKCNLKKYLEKEKK